MHKKIVIYALIILIVFFSVKITTVMASNNKDNNKITVLKVNNELEYIERKLRKSIYLAKKENWGNLENNINLIYDYWIITVLDLNGLEINNKYISEFGKKLNELYIFCKNQDSYECKIKICELYDYLLSYLNSYNQDQEYIKKFKVNQNLIKSYAIIENENWELVDKYILEAENNLKSIINSKSKSNNYNLKVLYVQIKELQNIAYMKNIELYNKKIEIYLNM